MRIRYWSSDVCSSDLAVPGTRNAVVFGQVIGIHIDESVLTNGTVDIAKLKPVSRLGYMDYCVVEDVFAMARPAWPVKPTSDAADSLSSPQIRLIASTAITQTTKIGRAHV